MADELVEEVARAICCPGGACLAELMNQRPNRSEKMPDCECSSAGHLKSARAAIAAWNRRVTTPSDTDTARLVERIRKTHREITDSDGGECGLMEMFRQAADTIDALKTDIKSGRFHNELHAIAAKKLGDTIDQQTARIEKLEAELRDQNKAILELQREACARNGVPMPSERPVVEKQAAEIAKLKRALESAAFHLEQTDDFHAGAALNHIRALESNQ